MEWLRRLLGPTPKGPAKKVPVNITFTDEEQQAIRKNREAFYSSADVPKGQSLYVHPKMAHATDAIGLIEYVEEQLTIASNVSKENAVPIVNKVISTLAKVHAMHDLPFYVFMWANVNENKGDLETAKRLYALFLRFQTEFKPDEVDNIVITYLQQTKEWFNVESAIKCAQRSIAER